MGLVRQPGRPHTYTRNTQQTLIIKKSGRWDSNPPLDTGDAPQALKACVLTTTPLPLVILLYQLIFVFCWSSI
jgi:hypothetical protein